jgi:SAM-dependent methyltransferase
MRRAVTPQDAGKDHWQKVYGTRAETEVSWYQPRPARSLELIAAYAPDRATPAIDIGAGASTLAQHLLDAGYGDVTVVDISETAIARTRARIGDRKGAHYIVADMTAWMPDRRWGIWHDRAAFHFLTDTQHQDAYIAALTEATEPGSVLIIATFALDGLEKCSGLPVRRYSPETLAARLGPAFDLVEASREDHPTPSGLVQRFAWTVLRRR